MRLTRVMRAITGSIDAAIKSLRWVTFGALSIMALVVVSNVVGRFLFHKPLLGTIELVELMMVTIVFFAMPYTAIKRGHVRVDLVTSRLSRRTQVILGSITLFLSAGIFGIITYQATVNAISYAQRLSKATTILFIPFAPFRFVMALGCLLLCLKLLVYVFHPLPPEEGRKGGLSK